MPSTNGTESRRVSRIASTRSSRISSTGVASVASASASSPEAKITPIPPSPTWTCPSSAANTMLNIGPMTPKPSETNALVSTKKKRRRGWLTPEKRLRGPRRAAGGAAANSCSGRSSAS